MLLGRGVQVGRVGGRVGFREARVVEEHKLAIKEHITKDYRATLEKGR